jgi:hypothetical protein
MLMKRFILILACTLSTTLSASLTDWPMHQRNAGHTGTNTDVLIQFPLALQREERTRLYPVIHRHHRSIHPKRCLESIRE